jgi:hypothetical protein
LTGFCAVHESVHGTSRHFAAAQQFGRFLAKRTLSGQAKSAELVENDLKPNISTSRLLPLAAPPRSANLFIPQA